MLPFSCDTFVVLPPATRYGAVIFGKNSDRPPSEVQELIYCPGSKAPGSTKCTYISVPAPSETHAVVLSNPAWGWGSEMGANEHSVVIGNEAVFTKAQSEEDRTERLTGMDLVRLGLERSQSAEEALSIITGCLESHGQGGKCYEDDKFSSTFYHNSFLIADGSCAWVLETAGKQWAAQKVTSGFRNISNKLSIGTQIDAMSEGLKEVAKQQGWWDGEGEFDFAKVYTRSAELDKDEKFSGSNRYNGGRALLEDLTKDNDFSTSSMFRVLRDLDSGICRVGLGLSGAATTASQVSVLYPKDSGKPCFHWFTATPNPSCSTFKPFYFHPDTTTTTCSPHTVSPGDVDQSLSVEERQLARKHALYRAHEGRIRPLPGDEVNHKVVQLMRDIEDQCVAELEQVAQNSDPDKYPLDELKDLFKESVETEIKFYTKFAD